MVRSLPQDLIAANILVRLPVKVLLRFKSVSKYWLHVISSPQFVKDHLTFSANHYRLLFWSAFGCKPKHYSVTPLFDGLSIEPFYLDYPGGEFMTIVGSVNGLVCLIESCGGFVLWNPSTSKFKRLPLPTSSALFTYGFGYDEVHDDYKIVGISNVESKTPFSAQFYSSKSDTWRELEPQGPVVWRDMALLVNGNLHWVVKHTTTCIGGDLVIISGDWGIISFDLVQEKFGKVVHPFNKPFYKERNKKLLLGELGSDLSIVCNYATSDGIVTQSVVWVMKEFGVTESWTKLYTIKYADNSKIHWLDIPRCMSSKGEILYLSGSNLKKYNPKDKSFTMVINYDHPHAILYIESLVCPVLQSEPMTQQ